MKKHINVVAAIIIDNDKYLCVQRGPNKYKYIAYKFEFAGGKIEENESDEDALKREIWEELSMEISNLNYYETVEHEYPDFKMTMKCFKCETKSNSLTLKEHVDFKWLAKRDLPSLDWAEADKPIINKILSE